MPLVTFAVTGTGTGVAQRVEVAGADHVIQTDAYPAFGGKDAHPSPLAYALAALSSCNQVTAQVVAAEFGITVEEYAFDVAADFDPTTMTTGASGSDDTFREVRVTARVTTSAEQEQVTRLGEEVLRRCPVSALFTRAGVTSTHDWQRVAPA